MRWTPWLLLCLFACDDATDQPAAGDCARADLVAQCPPGSNPLLGVQAESACTGAVGGVVSDLTGQATGQCYGVGSCRVVCQFAVPCRCGVASVTRDGVVCADCEGAASCGDGVCEGGESPENCPIDCGSVCEPDERRCDGEVLEVCSLQGRWDALSCPRDEVCSAEGGAARCVRDIEIIGGEDAGVDDDAGPPPPMDGRIIDGEGDWPVIASAARGETPRRFADEAHRIRLDDGSIHNRATPFAAASNAVFVREFRLVPGERLLQGFGRAGHFIAELDGTVLEGPGRPVDEAAFCDAAALCNRDTADCPAFIAAQRAEHGDRVGCVAADVIEGDCLALLIGCGPQNARSYPGGAQLGTFIRVGDRLLGVNGVDAVMVDLASNTRLDMEPVGEFRLDARAGYTAMSADGRVAAFMATSGSDEAVIIWDLEANTRRPILPESGVAGSRLALSPDGQVLAVARVPSGGFGGDEVLHLYDLNTDTRLYSIRPPPDATLFGRSLAGMRFSPDGRIMAVGVVPAQTVELWDLEARARTHILEFDRDLPIETLTFSPDGALLATTHHRGIDTPLNLWDVAGGQRLTTYPSPYPPVFEPDGSRVLIGSGGGAVRGDFVILSAP